MIIDGFVRDREKEVKKLERNLYDEIMSVIVGLLFVNGKAVFDSRNINVIAGVDTAFNRFNVQYQAPYLGKIITHLSELDGFYVNQFAAKGLNVTSFEGFGALMTRMDNYLRSVSLLDPVKLEVKNYLLGAISQGRSMGTIRQGLRSILGLKDRAGVLNRYYRAFIFDSIMHFDRMVSNAHAKHNDLNYLQYKGGLIETSMDFCIARDGLVFRRDQADEWGNDPSLPGYPDPSYDPLVELGRWNCRHYLLWLTDEEAKELNEKD